MEPRIQYAKTGDGVSIAFWVMGKGPPLICMRGQLLAPPLPPAPDHFRWFELMATKRTVIRYDPRGAGLSQRDVPDMSLSALVGDIEAVADALPLARFGLLVSSMLGPLGIAYAVRHPERLSGMVLWDATADQAHLLTGLARLDQLIEEDWEQYR